MGIGLSQELFICTRESQAATPGQVRIKQSPGRRRSVRPDFERLEDRQLLTSAPVNLGQFLQFRLEDPVAGVDLQRRCLSPRPCRLDRVQSGRRGIRPHARDREGGVTDTALNQFTIPATPQVHNTLNYLPNGEIQRLAPLFEFQNAYKITADNFVTAGVTPGGDVLAGGRASGSGSTTSGRP